MRKRLLTMLVLLVAVVTGAWADGIVCTASDLGKVLCTDGSIYENVSAAETAGKTAAAVIVYVDETNKKGLAIALADEAESNWSTAKSTCEGKTAITGAKWCLPSQDQWEQMFYANGGNTTSSDGLNTTINNAGGTTLRENATYWSSSENSPGVSACTVVLIYDIVGWGNGSEDNVDVRVRACLAFAPPSYAVTLAEGTEDADKWTIPAEAAEGTTVTATYSGTKKVKSVKAVKKNTAYAANEYNKGSWDGTKVIFTKQTAASEPTAVANSDAAVTWDAGWYTVSDNVTITGDVSLTADAHLILQDGATLTINGKLYPGNYNLYIYGQSEGTGKLNITNSGDAIFCYNSFEIHGGEITAVSTNSRAIVTGILNVYSGKLTATSDGGNGIQFSSSFDVYGGEVEGTSNATSSYSPSRGITDGGSDKTLTVYGGKVTATGNGKESFGVYGSGFGCYVQSGADIMFYFSDNGTAWDTGTYYLAADAAPNNKRYAKAE